MKFEDWEVLNLGDIFDFSSGLSKNAKEFGFGSPFLSFKTIFNNWFIPDEITDLANTDEKEQEKCSVIKGDVFLTRTSETIDELGMSCVALKNYPNATFNGFTKRLRPKKTDCIYPKFAGYYFRSSKFRSLITSMSTMTTRASLNNDMLSRLPICLPPISVQKAISDILFSLDEKIELNNKINANLEQQAQAIFKSWFVDFEPFQNGEFVNSELGMLPKGWKLGNLGQHVSISTKSFNPKINPNLTVEHYSIPAFDENKLPVFEQAKNIKSNKFFVTKETFLISKLNPSTKRIWRPFCVSENAVCSTEFIVFTSKNKFHNEFFYSLIDSLFFYDFMNSMVTGSTGSRQRVIPTSILIFPFALPPDNIIEDFCCVVSKMFSLIKCNILHNRELVAIRESLLPKLMNGEIMVNN